MLSSLRLVAHISLAASIWPNCESRKPHVKSSALSGKPKVGCPRTLPSGQIEHAGAGEESAGAARDARSKVRKISFIVTFMMREAENGWEFACWRSWILTMRWRSIRSFRKTSTSLDKSLVRTLKKCPLPLRSSLIGVVFF